MTDPCGGPHRRVKPSPPLLHSDTAKATRCHVIAGHDRHDRYSGQRPAAESHLVRLTEACIGCRCVDSHGSVKRSSLNHRRGCRALALGLQSLEACSQIAKECWRKREAPQQDRLQIYTGRGGTVRPERVTLILPPPARCQPLPASQHRQSSFRPAYHPRLLRLRPFVPRP
jgi:hypothetical protein